LLAAIGVLFAMQVNQPVPNGLLIVMVVSCALTYVVGVLRRSAW
jgi:hypothetical protein